MQQAAIARLESGKHLLSASTLARLADALSADLTMDLTWFQDNTRVNVDQAFESIGWSWGVCERCRTLIAQRPSQCPFCEGDDVSTVPAGVYEPASHPPAYIIGNEHREWLRTLESAKALVSALPEDGATPRISHLLSALANAQHYIHFISWGMSSSLAVALKMASHRVSVFGIVSGAEYQGTLDELVRYVADGYQQIHVLTKDQDWSRMPGQKLVVVDGILAFHGSANMTLQGWRKAQNGRNRIDVALGRAARDLNNRYFAPAWLDIDGAADS
jgi:phosphatidylserine/phosphatidylglycerophosphate/cardiolipin synthase-like enzyme